MFERRAILARGVGLVAGAAGTALAQDHKMPAHLEAGGTMTLERCIDLCLASHRICLETARYGLEGAPGRVPAALITMLSDCAEFCQATANSLMRGSVLHSILCDACAKACERCAMECNRPGSDEQLKRCAASCRECASACAMMGAMAR